MPFVYNSWCYFFDVNRDKSAEMSTPSEVEETECIIFNSYLLSNITFSVSWSLREWYYKNNLHLNFPKSNFSKALRITYENFFLSNQYDAGIFVTYCLWKTQGSMKPANQVYKARFKAWCWNPKLFLNFNNFSMA